jgi:hypothetical protein
MVKYRNLAILSVRWLGVLFLTLSSTSVLVVLTGPLTMGGMGGMMGSGQHMNELSEQMMPGASVGMMGGGWGMWWGPIVLFALIGVVLVLASRPLGAVMSRGLED